MGMVATLTRISSDHLEEMKISKEVKGEVKEVVDADKFWEHIMFVLGKGFLGREPTVWLFMPPKIIVTYKDEYQETGIRYHDQEDIAKILAYIGDPSEGQIRKRIDIPAINKSVMYKFEDWDFTEELVEYVTATINIFKNAAAEGDLILGDIG
jgi:hypothetical protein